MKYAKPALTDAQLLARWQAKGLLVPDPEAAERALCFIGYFRLRGYALPLMQTAPGGRVFKSGANFSDILARYELDRDLRRITLGQLESPGQPRPEQPHGYPQGAGLASGD